MSSPERLEAEPRAQIEIDPSLASYVPIEFKADPFGYFEREGKLMKQPLAGEVSDSEVRELPNWDNGEGDELATIGKRVSLAKAMVKKSGDPFYECKVMDRARTLGLPATRPIVRVSAEQGYLIIMERAPGYGWNSRGRKALRELGFTDGDLVGLEGEATAQMAELERRFTAAGLRRSWKLNDMVLDVDTESKRLRSLTPVDWERTAFVEG